MHVLVSALGTIRAPIIVALLAAAIIAIPGQSHEIFRAVRESTGDAYLVEVVRWALGTLVFAGVLLGCSILLIEGAPEPRRATFNRFPRAVVALALVLPLLPLIAMALANIDTKLVEGSGPGFGVPLEKVLMPAAIAIAAASWALLLVADGLRQRIFSGLRSIFAPFLKVPSLFGLGLAGALLAVVIALTAYVPRQFADAVGPIATLLLFCTFLCVFASLLTHLYDRHQVPAISLLLAVAVLSVYFEANNNHAIETIPAVSTPLSLESGFNAWLAARSDLDDYAGRPYPVYVVTAEGGGLYAATHAAFRLAKIQDRCPAFARHVFAISGVSGGSLGASVFAALMNANPLRKKLVAAERCPLTSSKNKAFEQATRDYFADDLLTPLLAAGLFADFAQRFIPYPVERFDRARALERGMSSSWDSVIAKAGRPEATELFERTLGELWSPERDAPALLLNATVVQTGDRLIASPFQLQDPLLFRDSSVDAVNGHADFGGRAVRLRTAVAMSARFPVVTPPASHRIVFGSGTPRDIQMVDGGYFENSGIQTAVDLIDKLRHAGPRLTAAVADATTLSDKPPPEAPKSGACSERNGASVKLDDGRTVDVCFKLLIVRAWYEDPKFVVMGEILSPLVALYQTRDGRGRKSFLNANRLYCGGTNCSYGWRANRPHIYASTIFAKDFALGWYFSRSSLESLAGRLEGLDDCTKQPETPNRLAYVEQDSNCVLKRIQSDLTGG